MSSGRAITFIFLSSAIMMGALLLQQAYGPQQVPEDQVALQQDGESDVSGEEEQPAATGDSQGTQEAGANPADPDSGSASSAVEKTGPETETPQNGISSPEANANDDEARPQGEDVVDGVGQESGDSTSSEMAALPQDEFIKLGSLDAGGKDRYLITINRRGGTIHQVELNARKKNGRYRYRDIVFEGGYLGSTNYRWTSDGLEVIAVGEQTPASLAGLRVGDLLKAIDGEPVFTVDQIASWLDKNSKPGQEIQLGIERNGESTTLTAKLTEKPISIIAPEGKLVDPDFNYPESFVMSLVKPQDFIDKAWPDLDLGMREANWEVTEASNDTMVELKYTIGQSQLDAFGLTGPLTVYKRYGLPEVDPNDPYNMDSRSFHIRFEVEVKNGSDQPMELAYQLDGPTGTSAETWWYANKIHGRQTAIFYIAGARDVVASTNENSYVFYGCPEIVKDADKERPQVQFISDPAEQDPASRQVRFLGVDSHYYNVSLLPITEGEELFTVNSAYAFPTNDRGRMPKLPKNARLQKLVDCTFQMVAPMDLPAGGSYRQSFDIFCGPKDPVLLDDYGLSDTRTFGWFSWCSIVLLEILHLFYWLTFETSYGLAIIMLTVLVRCIMIPFSRKAALNAQMMQHLAPQMKEIAEKYKDDMEKRASAQRDLYKKYNFNPFGGCVMMFFQLPIFYGLYKGLNVDIALRDQALIPGMQWCSNLAAPDQLLYWKSWSWMPAWLGDETGYLGPYLNILPLATMVLFIVQQRLFTPPATDENQKMMQKVMTFMMVFMGIMFFKVPAGLCIYFITSSLWGIVERKLLPKPVLDVDKFATAEGTLATTTNKKELRKARQQEQERAAEVEERKRRNADRKKRLKKRGM